MRTPAQLAAAAENIRVAQQARRDRSAIKHEIQAEATGRESRERCAAHLDSPHRALWSMTVLDLLRVCRGVGDAYARTMARRARVNPDRLVGALTERERDALIEQLQALRPQEALATHRSVAVAA